MNPLKSPESRISRLVANIEPSATLAVDAKGKALKAQGEPVVSFGAGEPDFPTPSIIVQTAIEAAKDPKYHKYTPVAGLDELRAALAEKTSKTTNYKVESSQVLVTNGGKQALYNSCLSLLNPGDEVLLPTPYWSTYPEAIKLASGIPVEVPTKFENNFHVTAEDLQSKLTKNTKMIILTSPNNPTGAVLKKEELIQIGEFAVKNNLWIITDEIYEFLVYDTAQQFSIVSLVPELKDTCLIINGVAKTYAMTGWRVGWIVGPKDVINAAINLQSQTTSNVNNIAQMATLGALRSSDEDFKTMKSAFEKRRQLIYSLLTSIEGIDCNLPEGAFYAYPSFKNFIGRSIGSTKINNTLDLAELILDKAKVAFVPGEAFGTPGYGRFSYALSQDDITEGINRIHKLLMEVN
jgi:aspartate/methionine/tyrosine aminotransferase